MNEEEKETLNDEIQDEQILDTEIAQEDAQIQEDLEESSKSGHMTKEEWVAKGKDPDKWKSPETYDAFGNLIQQNKSLKQRIYHTEYALNTLAKQFLTIRARERAEAEAELKQKFARAIDDGDTGRALELQQQMTTQQYAHRNEVAQEQAVVQDPGVQAGQEFIARNPQWFKPGVPAEYSPYYQEVLNLQNQAAIEYRARGLDPAIYMDDILQEVEQTIRNRPNEAQAGAIKQKVNPLSSPRSGGGQGGGVKDDVKLKKLSNEDRALYVATRDMLAKHRDKSGKAIHYSVDEFLASK